MRKLVELQNELQEQGFQAARLCFLGSGSARLPLPFVEAGSSNDEAMRLEDRLESAASHLPVSGEFVLYWMMAFRRSADNAALAVACELATRLGKPLLIYEGLVASYPWACERHHAFVLQGACERARTQPGYVFAPLGADAKNNPETLVSAFPDHSKLPEVCFTPKTLSQVSEIANANVLPDLLARAACVVTDWSPQFIYPASVLGIKKVLRKVHSTFDIPFVMVDDCGLVPLARYAKPEAAARFLRPKLVPFVQNSAKEFAAIEKMVSKFKNWYSKPLTSLSLRGRHLIGSAVGVSDVNTADYVQTVVEFSGVSKSVRAVKRQGGEPAAVAQLASFLQSDIVRYNDDRNHPDSHATSHLSPYLHYGMISPRTVVQSICRLLKVDSAQELPAESSAAKFIDELVTWRELGFNMARYAYEAELPLGHLGLVPKWAHDTLSNFIPPPHLQVSLQDLEAAKSPDSVWNAAQNELLRTGVIHNYMRMLWGKGIVRWSNGPEQALQRLEYLNNKYSLDGRDVNSYTGIYWCLGKFDRPWPPARVPFGMVRSMTTASAQKKLRLKAYLKEFQSR